MVEIACVHILWRYNIMMLISSAKKPSRGRPTIDSEAVNVRLERQRLQALDKWRRDQDDFPTRPEAIRRLIKMGLEATKGIPPKE